MGNADDNDFLAAQQELMGRDNDRMSDLVNGVHLSDDDGAAPAPWPATSGARSLNTTVEDGGDGENEAPYRLVDSDSQARRLDQSADFSL